MGSYRGLEMFDLHGDDHYRNNWVRGTCQYGFMPANGLIYAPPHACACYMQAKWDVKTIEQPDRSDAFSMAGCLGDLMSTDGTSIFLRHLRFNPELEYEKKSRHIFATSRFLNDSENHRSHWFLARCELSVLRFLLGPPSCEIQERSKFPPPCYV